MADKIEMTVSPQALVGLFHPDAMLGFAREVRDGVRPFVPYDTGRLAMDVSVESVGALVAAVRYNAPYAIFVYHGDRRGVTFCRERHPLASARWNEAWVNSRQ